MRSPLFVALFTLLFSLPIEAQGPSDQDERLETFASALLKCPKDEMRLIPLIVRPNRDKVFEHELNVTRGSFQGCGKETQFYVRDGSMQFETPGPIKKAKYPDHVTPLNLINQQ